jgi:hypothetical protein
LIVVNVSLSFIIYFYWQQFTWGPESVVRN